MSEPPIATDDRDAVQILALAGREFDRVRDLLVRDDEPGQKEVAESVGADDAADDKGKDRKRKGPVRFAFGAIGAVAGTAGCVVTGSVHPRHDDWATTSLDDRIDWWVGRFGTAAAALAAVPGLGGKVGKLVGIDDVVGGAAQILVVNAVAHEMGVTDLGQRVSAAARIVLGHEVDAAAVNAHLDDDAAKPQGEPAGDAPEEKRSPLRVVGRTAMLVWRVAGRIRDIRADLDNRRKGGFLSRAVSNFPGIGAVGAFVSERSGISKAADAAREAFSA